MTLNKNLFPDHQQPQLGKIFSEAMKTYPWSTKLEPLYSRLRATEAAIFEVPDGSQLFSIALWELCFPRNTQTELWHYTSIETLGGILRSGEIWLHSLEKRMGEGELTKFAEEFGCLGLLKFDKDGRRMANALARDLFFLSLTEADEAGDFWNYGEVRLRLRVRPLAGAHLRTMLYGSAEGNPLNVLKDFARSWFDRTFVPWQVSRQGAFFLDSYFSWESEVRLLIKRFEETTDLLIRDSLGVEAVAIPLGQKNNRVMIDLVRIEVDTPVNFNAVMGIMESNSKWTVPVSLYKE